MQLVAGAAATAGSLFSYLASPALDPSSSDAPVDNQQLVLRSQRGLVDSSTASMITSISLASRVSLHFTALLLGTLLESARFTSHHSLSLTRRALIAALERAHSFSVGQTGDNDALHTSLLDRYTSVGVYFIHSGFTMVELIAISGINLAGSALSTLSASADESVRLFDAIFGSTESSRALSSIIWLVHKELTELHPDRQDAGGLLSQLTRLSKALVAFALLQHATWRHTVRQQRIKPLFDATVIVKTGARQQPADEFTPARSVHTPEHASAVSPPDQQQQAAVAQLDDLLSAEDGEREENSTLQHQHDEGEGDANLQNLLRQLQGQTYEVETITTETSTTVVRILDDHISSSLNKDDQASILGVEDWVLTRRASSCIDPEDLPPPTFQPDQQRFKTVLKSMKRKLTRQTARGFAADLSASASSSGLSSGTATPVSPSQAEDHGHHTLGRLSPARKGIQRVFLSKTLRQAEQPSSPAEQHHDGPSSTSSKCKARPPASQDSTITVEGVQQSISWMAEEPRATNFPSSHLVHNLQRFCRFSSASYGQTFLRVLGIGRQTYSFPSTKEAHSNHHSFCAHTEIALPDLILSSFAEPTTFDNTRTQNMVYYLAIDHSASSIVLTCRGSLGLSDLITDLTCDFDLLHVLHAPSNGVYLAHRGMLAAARKLMKHGGRVHDALKQALQDWPSYGLVLTGHSLGGGVASLLAVLLACPRRLVEEAEDVGTSLFVTAPGCGLPEGRSISAYTYGCPCVASLDLAEWCKGLVITLVHGQDWIPSLSLGVLRDFVNLSVSLEDDPGVTGEVIGRVCGLYQSRFSSRSAPQTSQDAPVVPDRSSRQHPLTSDEIKAGRSQDLTTLPNYSDPALAAGEPLGDENEELEKWLTSVMKTIRAGADNLKLYPPGDVYTVNLESLFVTCRDDSTFTQQEGQRVVFNYVEDRERRFGEPVFSRRMLFDHSPGNYERAVDTLYTAVFG